MLLFCVFPVVFPLHVPNRRIGCGTKSKSTPVSRHIPLFSYFCGHFLNVESNGEEGKVHGDLVFAEVAEPFVLHVVFHLPEDGLRLYRAFGPVFQAFL